jgi:hypothetical protein
VFSPKGPAAADPTGFSAGASLSIDQFCQRHGISRGKYFNLRRAGLSPAEMRLGPNMVRISAEAELAWQHARQNPTADIEQGKAALAARGRKAGSVAVQSPKHITKTRRRARREVAVS